MRGRVFDKRGVEGTGPDASGQALNDPRGDDPGNVGGDEEHDHRDEFSDQSPEEGRAAANVVGQRPAHQQRRQESQGVDRESERKRPGGETPLLLAQGKQRRRSAGGEEEGREHRGESGAGRGRKYRVGHAKGAP
jgi:hypothetical protein